MLCYGQGLVNLACFFGHRMGGAELQPLFGHQFKNGTVSRE